MRLDRDSVVKKDRDLVVSPVQSLDELLASFELLYKQYLKYGYTKENSYGLRFSLRDLLPETMTFVARSEKELVGTVSIISNSVAGLPSKAIFKRKVEKLELGGKIIAEGTRFACIDEYNSKGLNSTAFSLLKWFFQWGQVRKVHDLILVINPKHLVFWKKILGFEVLAERKGYAYANGAPGILMRCDVAKANKDLRVTKAGKKMLFDSPYEGKDFLNHFRLNEEQVVNLLLRDLSIYEQAEESARWVFSQVYPFATKEIESAMTSKVPVSAFLEENLPSEEEVKALSANSNSSCFPFRWSLSKCIEGIDKALQKKRISFNCTVDDLLKDNLIGDVEIFEKAFYYTSMNLARYMSPYSILTATIRGLPKSGSRIVLEVSFFLEDQNKVEEMEITDLVFSPEFKTLRRLYSEMGGIVEVQHVQREARRLVFTCEFSIFEDAFIHAMHVDTEHPLVHEASKLEKKGFHKDLEDLEVLVVEDNAVSQFLLQKFFESYGLSVTLAGSGFSALRILQEKSFDFMILDCQMPGLDGFETAKRIRNLDSISRDIPIIACTAFVLKGDRERCLRAGMNDYVSKPIDPDALLKAVISTLKSGVSTYELLNQIKMNEVI